MIIATQLLLLALAAPPAAGPQLNARQALLEGRPLHVVCFGDSVTGVYYHTGSRRAYADMLQIALRRVAGNERVKVTNAGISGHTTVNALARIDKDVLRHKPDLVTVMFGLNDMTRVPLEKYRANLREIINRCRQAGAEVVLATPNNVINTAARPTEKLVAYCDAVRQVGRELGVPVSDCYQDLEALRRQKPFQWRLLMSDPIHPNMDGHQRLAAQLAYTISGERILLDDVGANTPALQRTLSKLREAAPVQVLAMPPLDQWVEASLRKINPNAQVKVTSWPVAGMSLAEIEADAKRRVRAMKPDLVLLAVPRTAAAKSDEAFVHAYAWTMNWSLNFGSPTWDCVVVHPAVIWSEQEATPRDGLVRQLVLAQDLHLIDRTADDQQRGEDIVKRWFAEQGK